MGRSADNPAVALLFHIFGGGAAAEKYMIQVSPHRDFPVIGSDLVDIMGVADNTGVIDQDIDAAEVIYRRLDDTLRLFLHRHAAVAGNGGPAGGLYLFNNTVSHGMCRTMAVIRGADVVNDHFGTLFCHRYGLGAPDAAAGPGNHRYPPFE
jgi:hypothetical protein